MAQIQKKRKLPEAPEIEIDVSAPEPPSKKALRKAKKTAAGLTSEATPENNKSASADDQALANKRSDYGVWIGNLAFTVTKDDIRRFLTSNCSFADTTITRIHMPKGAEKYGKAQNKGFAYVDFSTSKAAKEALGLSEQLVSGRRVLIKDAKSFEGRPEKSKEESQKAGSASSGHPPSRRIFVGNLGFDTTKETIEEHFGQCGTVTHVHVATFQDSGKCKGYAWVEFEELPAAEAAVKGFIVVNEDEGEDDSEEEAGKSKKSKKSKQRRVWVNQLLGRRMRMEFAEDASTRYKKRFGKDGESKRDTCAEASEVEDGSTQQKSVGKQHTQRVNKKTKKSEYSRYDEGTVQKLSGAIVESQGKKTTFD
ncbi:hypothetical protein EYZ11_011835 [Aspergillus tanneri]|uniref:RRM domain-containing protein n=1 Tax=Aspergillus tanneri TaxID=1220188 RepID=A0A4S3J1S7_9EURO|nr:uncharacterized protein ATNIH1004_006905 [Aspergillus tanneri]KAA8645486.1 hypothetical protein ATNIH1004_006905 [Aspergillus tanneri]THC88723.1 hypothetical protein EYZ11_011835 [Aspergillus tanneri]